MHAAALEETEAAAFRRRTPASARWHAEARAFLPGGDSRSTVFYQPYPAIMERGEGCRLHDLDGNVLLDFTGNHSSLVHGYGHPGVLDAVRAQLARGTAFPSGTRVQIDLARHLTRRIPSLDLVRFTNSGTEAAMLALRGARAFTGRNRVGKAEGGYHGSTDEFMVSTHPDVSAAGPVEVPRAVPASKGLPAEAVERVLVIPFNDAPAAVDLIEREREDLAAVFIEPVMGSAGMIPAERQYLVALREVTRKYGIVLVFDEVVSFRVAHGGAEEAFGVRPDLTVLGKLVGGGFPLGAFGGRRDIMALFDPSAGRPAVPHPGSYNANPVSLAAGLASLEALDAAAIAGLNRVGDAVRTACRAIFADAALTAQLTGMGSLFGIHLTVRTVRAWRDTVGADLALRHRLFLALYNEGVLIDPRGVGAPSTAIGMGEVEQLAAALRRIMLRLRPSAGLPHHVGT